MTRKTVLLLITVALLSTTLAGCSRLINSTVSAAGSAPPGTKPVSGPVSYQIIPADRDKVAEKAFRDALSAHGISTKPGDSPDGEHLHVIVYLLEPVPSPLARAMIAPMAVVAFATIGLVPFCIDTTYPVDIHALAPPSSDSINRTGSIHAQYTVDECSWLPRIAKASKELAELKYLALRHVFDDALERLPR